MGKETLTYSGHLLPTMCAVFSSDGELIASGGGDSTVKVWKAADGRDIFTIERRTTRPLSIVWPSARMGN